MTFIANNIDNSIGVLQSSSLTLLDTDAAKFPPSTSEGGSNFYILVDSEIMQVTAANSHYGGGGSNMTTWSLGPRGQKNTAAASHTANAIIYNTNASGAFLNLYQINRTIISMVTFALAGPVFNSGDATNWIIMPAAGIFQNVVARTKLAATGTSGAVAFTINKSSGTGGTPTWTAIQASPVSITYGSFVSTGTQIFNTNFAAGDMLQLVVQNSGNCQVADVTVCLSVQYL